MPHGGHDHDDHYQAMEAKPEAHGDLGGAIAGRQGSKEQLAAEQANYEASKKKLCLVSVVTVFFIIAQSIGGYLSGSIAIITDTAHLATDMIGFAISLFCLKLSQKDASKELTYGWHRSEIIGTLVSIIFLVTVTMWLLKEAIGRAIAQPEIQSQEMLITAVAGLFFNLIQMQILHQGDGHYHLGGDDHDHGDDGHDHGHAHEGGHHEHGHGHEKKDTHDHEKGKSGHDHGHGHSHSHGKKEQHEENINVSAAYCHALSDMIMSIGVIIAATIIYFKPAWRIADPICTFVFSVIVCLTVVPITKKCVHVLMEGAPPKEKVNVAELVKAIKKQDPEMELRDLHVWSITNSKVAFSCHIKTKQNTQKILKEVSHICKDKYKLGLVTIQVEDANIAEHQFESNQTTDKNQHLDGGHGHGHHH